MVSGHRTTADDCRVPMHDHRCKAQKWTAKRAGLHPIHHSTTAFVQLPSHQSLRMSRETWREMSSLRNSARVGTYVALPYPLRRQQRGTGIRVPLKAKKSKVCFLSVCYKVSEAANKVRTFLYVICGIHSIAVSLLFFPTLMSKSILGLEHSALLCIEMFFFEFMTTIQKV